MEKTLTSLAELETEVSSFVDGLVPKESGATLVTLSGELGAGKTAFTKAAARALGVEEIVNSPTFVLEKIYQLAPDKPFKRLIHIDAYRLASGDELSALGFDEILKDAGNLIFLEWPEKVADALPPAKAISITTLTNDSRTISYA